MVRISRLTLPLVAVLVAFICASGSAQPNTGAHPFKTKLPFSEEEFQQIDTALNSRDPVLLIEAMAQVGSIAGLDPDFAQRYKPRLKQLLNSEHRRVREIAVKALRAYALQDGTIDERETINTLRSMGATLTFNSSGKVGFVRVPPGFGDSDVPLLLELKELERLGMGKCEVTNTGVAQLTKLQMLRSLILPPNTTNAALRGLTGLRNLEELGLVSTQINDEGLVQLRDFKRLRIISLPAFERISDHGLAPLRQLSELRNVGLPNNISNAAMAYLAELPNLESLQIAYCKNITDEGLIHVERMRNLKIVRLPPTITDAGLYHLRNLTTIERLDLRHCAITDEGLKHVRQLEALEILQLPKGITDKAFDYLRNLPDLHWLAFHGELITDQGILGLADFPALRRVDIVNGGFSEAALADLRRERPNLRIETAR